MPVLPQLALPRARLYHRRRQHPGPQHDLQVMSKACHNVRRPQQCREVLGNCANSGSAT